MIRTPSILDEEGGEKRTPIVPAAYHLIAGTVHFRDGDSNARYVTMGDLWGAWLREQHSFSDPMEPWA